MRLITWNCQGAFRKKVDVLLSLRPDICVIQECEHSDRFILNSSTPQPKYVYWHGDNMHKGIGIFCWADYTIELLDCFNPAFKYILPFKVTADGHSFILFAVWAMNNLEDRKLRYIGQVFNALNHYAHLLTEPAVLTGDLNSNKIWDHQNKSGSHTMVVDILKNNKIVSVYHTHLNEEQGKELTPTFYLQKNKSKPYHLDYFFVSQSIYNNIRMLEVGTYEHWIKYSDHVPITIEIDLLG